MSEGVGAGYLTRTEANLVGLRAAPDVVFLRLVRDVESEGERTCMFTELTPRQARELIKNLQEVVEIAVATSDENEATLIVPGNGAFLDRG
jgi:hypothetical protein